VLGQAASAHVELVNLAKNYRRLLPAQVAPAPLLACKNWRLNDMGRVRCLHGAGFYVDARRYEYRSHGEQARPNRKEAGIWRLSERPGKDAQTSEQHDRAQTNDPISHS